MVGGKIMTCYFELFLNEKPEQDPCKACFWWLHKKNNCVIQGKTELQTEQILEEITDIKQLLDQLGFPIGKMGYRNLMAALELLCAQGAPGPNDIKRTYQLISRETGRSSASIRQSVRSAIICAWESGTLKKAFPNWQKRPRLLDLYYFLQNRK